MAHGHAKAVNPADFNLPDPTFVKFRNLSLAAFAVGAVLSGIGAASAKQNFFYSYLTAFMFWIAIAIGSLFFVLIQHLTRSGWSVVVRRIAEAISTTLPVFALLFIPVIFGMHELYPWTHEGHVSASKSAYLNTTFFLIRAAAYFAVWIFVARKLAGLSYEQDKTGDENLTVRAQGVAPLGMFLFALATSFAAFDWIMSMQPHWYSTIFGVYYFASCAIGIFAVMSLIAIMLRKLPGLDHTITDEHLHGLGKMLFGFTVFWAYIAFSQFLLIWYANIPEETEFFHHRFHHGWELPSAALLVGHFALAFLMLLPRGSKRTPAVLAFGSLWQLFFVLVDLFWLIAPHKKETPGTDADGYAHFSVQLGDVGAWLLIGGVFSFLVARKLKGAPLVPYKDPRLAESLVMSN